MVPRLRNDDEEETKKEKRRDKEVELRCLTFAWNALCRAPKHSAPLAPPSGFCRYQLQTDYILWYLLSKLCILFTFLIYLFIKKLFFKRKL